MGKQKFKHIYHTYTIRKTILREMWLKLCCRAFKGCLLPKSDNLYRSSKFLQKVDTDFFVVVYLPDDIELA